MRSNVINHVNQWLRQKGVLALAVMVIAGLALPVLGIHRAAAAPSSADDFNILVSPSPLAVKLTPGKSQSISLTVRNLSNHSETLFPRLSGFTIDKYSKDIKLSETAPANMAKWVSFTQSSLAIPAGASKQLGVSFNTPADVGFSYSAAITLGRSQSSPVEGDGVHLRGAVAVFCLVNIDRPDAKSQLAAGSLTPDKNQYQFLPAQFKLTVENKGNIIGQPTGSLFIQRTYDSPNPITTIPINRASSYILPGTSRDFVVDWNEGFPAYVRSSDGSTRLSWDWRHLNQIRFGRYVAKAVVIYSDGQRDVPVTVSTVFWVIPWGIIFGSLFIIIVLIMGVIGWGRLIFKGTRKVKGYASQRK